MYGKWITSERGEILVCENCEKAKQIWRTEENERIDVTGMMKRKFEEKWCKCNEEHLRNIRKGLIQTKLLIKLVMN